MKICHLTSAHRSNDVRIFTKECTSLARAGYEVYLVAAGESREENGVHVVGLGKAPGSRRERMTAFANSVYRKALELNCDIYHFHDPELLPYGRKLLKKGKVVIFDSHENTVEQIKEKTWIPALIRYPLYFLFDHYQRIVCKEFSAIVSVTPHICDYFKKINPNTHMITNYPILDNSIIDCNCAKECAVCFAGGISPQWNHERIIEAVSKVENCKYILCGAIDDNYFEKLKSLPGWCNVDYRGVVPHDEVRSILGTSQVGMAVLEYNHNTAFKTGTLGNTKIFEEMALGLPIVCTDFDLWRGFVEKYNCGICVDPRDTEQIKNAIQFLLDHPEEAHCMGQNGRLATENVFNWANEETRLLKIYDELLTR